MPMKLVSLPVAHSIYPISLMVECGLWAALSPPARAVHAVLWDYHREYPDSCHPSRATLARQAGVSPPTVTRCLKELERVGLVTVLPAPGPRANTYRLNWIDLRMEVKDQQPGGTAASPYTRSPKVGTTSLITGTDGKERAVYNPRAFSGYPVADGCRLASAKEVFVHDRLIDWGFPHWCGVTYHDLGIPLSHMKTGKPDCKSTVDFVLGPRLLLEVRGLPATQSAAKNYEAKLLHKARAAKAAGWDLVTIGPDKYLWDNLVQRIVDHWGKSSVEDAQFLKRRLSVSQLVSKDHRSSLRLAAHIADAESRLRGENPPASGCYGDRMEPDPTTGVPQMVKGRPRLVLMAEASASSATTCAPSRNVVFNGSYPP